MRSQTNPRSSVLFATMTLLALSQTSAVVSGAELVPSENGSKGLFQKLIIIKDDVEVEWHPECRERGDGNIKAFSIFWRLATDTPDNIKDGKLLAGSDEGDPFFYVNKEDVKIWDTRTALEPRRPATADDPAMKIYKDQSETQTLATLDPKAMEVAAGMKILALVTGKGTSGEEDENLQAFPVTIFAGDMASEGGKAGVQGALENMVVEIVFVCDTTQSMQPLIDTAKKLMNRVTSGIAGELRQAKGAVRFGIVEYRDEDDTFITKVTLPLDDDPKKTLDALDNITVEGGGDFPEAVTSGLKTAIDDAGYQENSSKHIILMGDAPNKDAFGPTIEQIIEKSNPPATSDDDIQKAAITIHTVLAYGGGYEKDADAENDFKSLAAGGNTAGFLASVNIDSEAEKNNSINDFYDQISGLVSDLIKVRAGEEIEKTPSTAGNDNMRKAVWKIVDASTGGTDLPVHEGYASITTKEGDEVARKKIMVMRKDIISLQARLDMIISKLRKLKEGEGNIESFITTLQEAAVEMLGGDDPDFIVDGDTTLAEIIGDLPMKTNSLKLTIGQIAVMQPADFDTWLLTLKDAKRRAFEMMDNPSAWKEPNGLFGKPGQVGFFEKSALP